MTTLIGSIIVFAIFGFIIEQNYKKGYDFTGSEAGILLGIACVVYMSKILPIVFENSIVQYEQLIPLRREMKYKLVKTSFEKIKAKQRMEEVNDKLVVITRGNYGMEFLMTSTFTDGIKNPVAFESHPTGSSYGRFRLLFVLSAYTSILALIEQNFKIPIPLFSAKIDAEIFFALFIILLYSFLFLQNSIQHNFFFEFEQLQKYVLPELAKNSFKLDDDSDGDGEGGLKVDLKSDLEAAKERARKITDSKAKLALDEKRQKARQRVDHIIGRGEDDQIDPELLKKQLLIRRVKTLLKSTPVGYNATLTAITEKVESENPKEIEAIIVGLIDRKEVSGSYDMWEGAYSNGDVSAQFIDRTLTQLDLDPSELEFIKVSSAGDVEIRFKNEKTNGASATNGQSKAKRKKVTSQSKKKVETE